MKLGVIDRGMSSFVGLALLFKSWKGDPVVNIVVQENLCDKESVTYLCKQNSRHCFSIYRMSKKRITGNYLKVTHTVGEK